MGLIPGHDAHIAGSSTDTFTTAELITGDFPLSTTTETVADAVIADADLPAYSVVGRDATGKIVMAEIGNVDPDDDIHPIGITANTVKEDATVKTVAVYRSGCFNPDLLNWDASYNTDAKKRLAFEVLGNPIFIQKVAA